MMAKRAKELHGLYITQRLTGDDLRNLDTNPMSKGYSEVMKMRVADMMNRITNGTMPFIQWGTTKRTYAKGVNRWSEDFLLPRSLWAPSAKEDVQQECHIAINNVLLLVKETEKNGQALPDARAHMEHRFAWRKLTPESIVKRTHCVLTVRCYTNLDAPRQPRRRQTALATPARLLPVFGPHGPGHGPPPGAMLPAHPRGP